MSDLIITDINKRQRIPKGQSKRDNPEKLPTHAVYTRRGKKNYNTCTICVEHQYTQIA